MFNKVEFAKIIKKISAMYESQREFATLSGINRTYLSQYMNAKLDNPPKPKILERLAKASKNLVSYKDLMLMCNYIDEELDRISGESISVFSSPYVDLSTCTPSEDYIYSIIYTYEILETTNYTETEKKKIIDSYNYIKNDSDYSKYIIKHNEFKKAYYSKKRKIEANVDDADIAFASGIKGLNETNKMIIKNTIEALLAKQEKDEENKK